MAAKLTDCTALASRSFFLFFLSSRTTMTSESKFCFRTRPAQRAFNLHFYDRRVKYPHHQVHQVCAHPVVQRHMRVPRWEDLRGLQQLSIVIWKVKRCGFVNNMTTFIQEERAAGGGGSRKLSISKTGWWADGWKNLNMQICWKVYICLPLSLPPAHVILYIYFSGRVSKAREGTLIPMDKQAKNG